MNNRTNTRAIVVTERDLIRLRALLRAQNESTIRNHEHLEDLQQELERATVVDADEVPSDVVTMHSRVLIEDALTGAGSAYTLVFPSDADVASGRISVLAPLGTALLGYREGDELEWQMPGGLRRLRIRKVIPAPRVVSSEEGRGEGESPPEPASRVAER